MTELITHTTNEQAFCELVEVAARMPTRYRIVEPVGSLVFVADACGCSLSTARRAVKKFREGMMIWKNRRGDLFQTGIGGTYPVNDGNPENDVDLPDDFEIRDDSDDYANKSAYNN